MACNHSHSQKFGKTSSGSQRYRCRDCGLTFTQSTDSLAGMRIGVDKATAIIRCLTEGMGVRATGRINHVGKAAVLDTLVLIGERCKLFTEAAIVDVPVKDVQADELWSFVYCKEKTRVKKSLPRTHFGDQYCYVGFERHSKLVLAWHMGNREMGEGEVFIRKLHNACCKSPFQVTTDGWQSYKKLIRDEMSFVHFGMLVKLYTSTQDTTRYSPGTIFQVKKHKVMGQPVEARMCTSHVERTNLTIRMQLRRFTRLTNGFSRKWRNHDAALGLLFAHYNFCQKHGSLQTTPAVAAGVADHVWSVGELIERTKGYSPPPPPTAMQRFFTLEDE